MAPKLKFVNVFSLESFTLYSISDKRLKVMELHCSEQVCEISACHPKGLLFLLKILIVGIEIKKNEPYERNQLNL